MKIVAWIRSRLRRWLLDDPALSNDRTIECFIRKGGKVQRTHYRVVGAVGLRLLCEEIGGSNSQTISAGEAVDQVRFWHLWRSVRGGVSMTWADGTPADADVPRQSG